MKTSFSIALLALFIASLPVSAAAQVSYGAEAYAARQQEEERWLKLNARVEELISTQEVLRKKVADLEEENRHLRTEVTKARNAGVTPEEFQRVVREIGDGLKKVDEKRVADNKALLEQMKALIKDLKPAASLPNTTAPPRANEPVQTNVPGFTHTIADGETISGVVEAFRARGVRTSIDAVLKNNPGLDPKRMKVGQEVFIPDLR